MGYRLLEVSKREKFVLVADGRSDWQAHQMHYRGPRDTMAAFEYTWGWEGQADIHTMVTEL